MKTKSRRLHRRSTPTSTTSRKTTASRSHRSSTHLSNEEEQQSLGAAKPNETRPQSEGDADSDDDEHLLHAAAAAWASTAAEAQKDNNDTTRPGSAAQPDKDANDEATITAAAAAAAPRSVHITQISFQANQLDLHNHFASQGCLVSSVRPVYDKGLDRQRQFRGVAFIDLADHDSYQKALELDKSILMGRKINVRPTKSAQELSNIVQTTQQLIAAKIRSSKDQSNGAKDGPPSKRAHPTKPRNRGSDLKLTKKERNKRAAILRQKKKG